MEMTAFPGSSAKTLATYHTKQKKILAGLIRCIDRETFSGEHANHLNVTKSTGKLGYLSRFKG